MIAPGLPRCPTIVHALAAAVAQTPFVTALVCGEQRLSYDELGRGVGGLARRLLALGAQGERVLTLLPTSTAAVVTSLAVLAARAVLAPCDPELDAAELARVLDEVEPRLIVCDAASAAALSALSPGSSPTTLVWGADGLDAAPWLADTALDLAALALPAPDERAVLWLTKRSGGWRGVEHAHAGLALSLLQHCTRWPVAFGRDRFLSVAPLFEVWGLLYSTFVPIYARGTLVLLPGPGRALEAIEQHAITVFVGAPASLPCELESVRAGAKDLTSLRLCLSSGAPLPPALLEDWQRATGRRLLQSWGLPEAAPLCLEDPRAPARPGSVGRAAPLTELSIVDPRSGAALPPRHPGAVRVRGPQLMLGYPSHPDETNAALVAGWLHTAALGHLDEDGHLFLIEAEQSAAR